MAHARRGGKKITETRWAGFNAGFAAQAAGSAAENISVGSPVSRETLLRTRGTVIGYLDGVQNPGALVLVSLGLRLVPAGTGTTVLTDPFGESAAPWFYYEEFHLGYEEMVTDVVDVPGMTSFRAVIDSKAMRIIRPETEIQLVMTNTSITSTASVNVRISGRFLFGD